MKFYGMLICALLSSVTPLHAIAGWQVAKSDSSSIPREPFFQTGTKLKPIKRSAYVSSRAPLRPYSLGQPTPAVYAVSISGSLKENMERIMGRYHWKVVWKAPYDFNFDGRVTGSSLSNVIEKLLQPFPLQAVMYMSNRTLIVTPRSRYRT